MRAIHIQKYGRTPILTTCPIPARGKDQYLIKVKYAPINPSDLNFYIGSYGIKKEGFPIMGFEGSGVIEQCEDSSLIGRKVSMLSNSTNGTYADYIVSNPDEIILWPNNTEISDDQLSMYSINPLSVMGLCDFVERQNAKTIVLSAATSNVNKMIIKYLTKKFPQKRLYGLSRSSRYDDLLQKLGLNKVYRMEQLDKLKNDLSNQGKSVFLDCIGGNFAGQVFNLLPPDSTMVNYGRLSKENLGSIDLAQLYFKNKFIRGFWLNTYLKQLDPSKVSQIKSEIIENANIFKQPIRSTFTPDHFVEATRESIKDQSQGKILLNFS